MIPSLIPQKSLHLEHVATTITHWHISVNTESRELLSCLLKPQPQTFLLHSYFL